MGDHIRAIEQDKANLYTKANDKFRSMDFELKKLASDNEALKVR